MAISRGAKWALGIAASLVALPVALIVLFVAFLPGPSEDEVARVASPDGKLEAVLVETNGGATTSFGYEVHVVERARKPYATPAAFMYGAVRSENAYGANLRWEKSDLVAVEFLSAKSSKLMVPSISVGGLMVSVALRPGVADPTALAGGMLFNLQGRR